MTLEMTREGMLCLLIPKRGYVHEGQCEGRATLAMQGSGGESV